MNKKANFAIIVHGLGVKFEIENDVFLELHCNNLSIMIDLLVSVFIWYMFDVD